MLFHTPAFAALLASILVLFYAFPRGRLWLLAVADAVFYGLPNPAHLPIFLAVSLVTHYCALGQREVDAGAGPSGTAAGPRTHGPRANLLFATGLLVNAANLIFFKYALFFTRSVEGLLGVPLPALDSVLVRVALPVGISFYTFQLVGYLVDARRGQLAPARSFAQFWVFISLFPKVVAGPISRGRQLLPQVEAVSRLRLAPAGVSRGPLLLLVGLVKKVVLADTLSPFVDRLFAQGASLGGVEAWIAAYLFTFQIYFDFSAYSDMAVGVGALLGFDLPQNFHTPYVSAGSGEFWRRWHVTLSTWIRDYVYIPLGGSRAGLPRQLGNLLLALAFSGLWHGAAWTFVVWGLYHGCFSVAEKLAQVVSGRTRGRRARTRPDPVSTAGRPEAVARPGSAFRRLAAVAVCFHVVVAGWVLFRSADLGTAVGMLGQMLSPSSFAFSASNLAALALVVGLYLLHLAEYLARRDGAALRFWRSRVPAPARGLAYALVITLILVFVQTERSTFIYSRF
jgi:alginate O-acetyltransferase complex protein AlgI